MDAPAGTNRRHLIGLVCATAMTIALLGPAQAMAGGALTATPSALNFGNVPVGSSLAMNVVLTNFGPDLISNDYIDGLNGAEFATNSACDGKSPTNAAPCTIQVTFTPTSAGSKLATLHIPNNGGNPNLQVPLSGTSLTPLLPLAPTPPVTKKKKCKKKKQGAGAAKKRCKKKK